MLERPKAKANISIDSQVWQDAERVFGRDRSRMIEEFLQNSLNTKRGDVSGINFRILKNKQSRLTSELSKIQSELADVNQHIQDYEELRRKREERKLEKQKEEAEKQVTCNRCSSPHKFEVKGEKLCRSCFLGLAR